MQMQAYMHQGMLVYRDIQMGSAWRRAATLNSHLHMQNRHMLVHNASPCSRLSSHVADLPSFLPSFLPLQLT